jgi:Ca2+-binding RTX toxin-like protein
MAAACALVPAAHAAVTFQPKQGFASSSPFYLATGDFNADGRVDVATSRDLTAAGTNFSVLLGNGDGTLQAPRNTAAASQQNGVAAGDLNGDGRDDVVIISIGSNDATRFLSQGDGTFGAGASDAVGSAPQDVQLARVDADGDLDIVVASQIGDRIDILLNDGAGNFTAALPLLHGLTGNPDGVVAADFDSDGDNDLAIGTTGGGTAEVAFARNQGTGTFDPPVGLGTVGQKLVGGDLNGDGRPDIAASRTANGNVAIILRNAANTGFDAATTFDPEPTAVNAIAQLATADLDGDGVLDLAIPHVSGPQAGKVSVGIGRGNGQFDLNSNEPAGTQPREVVAADFNGDSNLDLATANSGSDDVSVLLANPPNVVVTPSLDFGLRRAGTTSEALSATLMNNGAPWLRPGAVALAGPDADQFAIASNTCTGARLAPTTSCAVGVTFTPRGAGSRSATLTMASNAAGSPHLVQLTGVGEGEGGGDATCGGAIANPVRGTGAGDTLTGTAASDAIFGFAGNDVLNGLGGNDCLNGAGGDDRLSGAGGNDRLSGGSGRDRLGGGSGRDRLSGGSANDRLSGGTGNDRLIGGGGSDRLIGGRGKNAYDGGRGNDRIRARNRRAETVRCGRGRDRAVVDARDRVSRCELVLRR